MRRLKNIRLTPMQPVDIEKAVKISEEKKYDFTHLNQGQLNDLFADIHKFVKNTKKEGVIFLKQEESNFFASLAINSGANRKNIHSFPIPNPVRLNYSLANKRLELALNLKNKLLQVKPIETKVQYDLFCRYYECISIGVIFLVGTIEAFINQIIPKDIEIQNNEKTYKKSDIEFLDFNRKITFFLPIISSKNFRIENGKEYDMLSTLNSIRDDLIHLKLTEDPGGKLSYDQIFKRILDLPIVECSQAVFNFVNYYIPNYFELQSDFPRYVGKIGSDEIIVDFNENSPLVQVKDGDGVTNKAVLLPNNYDPNTISLGECIKIIQG